MLAVIAGILGDLMALPWFLLGTINNAIGGIISMFPL